MKYIEEKNTEEVDENTDVTNKNEVTPSPFPAPSVQPAVPDLDTLYPSDPVHVVLQPSTTQVATLAQPSGTGQVAVPVQKPIFVSDSQYLLSGGFNKYIADNMRYANRKTGFKNIDGMRPFSPGLYLIMAETSAGKTTFVLQWCSQVAAQGEYVLFFGLEQSRDFLISKHIARDFFETYREDAARNNGQSSLNVYDATALRNGYVDSAELNRQQVSYAQKTADRMYTISTNFSGSIDDICDHIDAFIEQKGEPPVVVIDYIQLLNQFTTLSGYMFDTKTSMDMGIHKLKQYQESRGLTILVISSLSRQGYTEPIALSHAKESGMLEYTADVVIGLQLRAIHNDYDQNKKKLNEAQKKANLARAKSETPRKVEAVFLKDRCGMQNSTVYFDYYSAYETFVPTDINGKPM